MICLLFVIPIQCIPPDDFKLIANYLFLYKIVPSSQDCCVDLLLFRWCTSQPCDQQLAAEYDEQGLTIPMATARRYQWHLVNCQKVEYSSNWVYVTTHGIPAYPTGPFLDGNPSIASDQIPFSASAWNRQNTGTLLPPQEAALVFLHQWRRCFEFPRWCLDGTQANALCGGPGNPTLSGRHGCTDFPWNRCGGRRAQGFWLCQGHPAMGNYHHHPEPQCLQARPQ